MFRQSQRSKTHMFAVRVAKISANKNAFRTKVSANKNAFRTKISANKNAFRTKISANRSGCWLLVVG